MSLTQAKLKKIIHSACFPMKSRETVFNIIWNGVELFREYRSPRYCSTKIKMATAKTGLEIITKVIKRPLSSHDVKVGRYDQSGSRTVLISAIFRGWMEGFEKRPSLNNKKDKDTDFAIFASEILSAEHVGKPHKYLEEYWSTRKRASIKMSN